MKPILFNTEMVRAILAGRKTQTRRLCKIYKFNHKDEMIPHEQCKTVIYPSISKKDVCADFGDEDGIYLGKAIRPYEPGDILYARETWASFRGWCWGPTYIYKAGYDPKQLPAGYITKWHWHPSIHMPKEAARIFLRVTDVRVEQLQDMTVRELIAEGGANHSDIPYHAGERFDDFKTLWNSTIPKKDLEQYGWDANPWVWVIEFERISKEETE